MNKPRVLSLLLLPLISVISLFAQLDDTSVREKALEELRRETEAQAKVLEARIARYDDKIRSIDEALQNTRSVDDLARNLKERVTTLEAILAAQKEKELNVFSSNYQSAVINLISLERELRPLELFDASMDFFRTLEAAVNPSRYLGYKEWFSDFSNWLERNKTKDEILQITSRLLQTSGEFSGKFFVAGPLSETLLLSFSRFIQSIDKKRTDYRQKSMAMFELSMMLGQFNADLRQISLQWDDLDLELRELHTLQKQTLEEILKFLGENPDAFLCQFVQQTDAYKRLDYLNHIRRLADEAVKRERNLHDSWKDRLHYDMLTVQSLKIRFGQATFKIVENLKHFESLIKKHHNDEQIGSQMHTLQQKLQRLSSVFDVTFQPQQYVRDAAIMYRIF